MAVTNAEESVIFSNVKTVGEASAFYAGLAMGDAVAVQRTAQQNAVAHQQGMNTVLTAAVGAIVKGLVEVDPTEAISVLKEMTGDEVAQKLVNILGALTSNQQATGVSANTPPSGV